jgi:predicted Zn-dependent peptidase
MQMRIGRLAPWLSLLVASLSIAAPTTPPAAAASAPLIPHEKFMLDNGLTVIVAPDHKAPIVAVNVWYHVGSKNERAGKTGFAHLFEHLMFQGSENFNDEYFKPFEQVGATSQNGTTSFDRTNYFQNVPTTAVDLAMWMESDRMGHLLGVIDQPRLDEQRGVVQNEKRQNENRPYGRVFERLLAATYPVGHPYHWLPIGSMDDLNAASLDDVKDWFRTYYGAANAVLVLAGDIDTPRARELAQKYFGDIPPGPAITRPQTWTSERTESTRDVMYDQVAQTRLYRAWNIPASGTEDADLLDIAAQILGGGKTSRLFEKLVYRDQIADNAFAGTQSMEIAGLFLMLVDVKATVAQQQVETALGQTLNDFLAKGPTPEELERAKSVLRADFLRGLERIGGFGGKADVLASCEVFEGDSNCYTQTLERYASATPAQVQAAAKRWLSHGDYTLEVQPQPKYQNAASSAVERKAGPPVTATFPDLTFPALQRAKLSNGLPVIVAARSGAPVVNVALLFDAGYAADLGRKPGTANFAINLLEEGTTSLDTLQIAGRAEALGAQLNTGSALDSSFVGISALTERLDPSLALLADVVRNPAFPPKEIERVRKEWIAGIEREKTNPEAVATRVLPPLLYGDGHPYAIPFTGTGTEASVAALTRDDLTGFQRDWLRPDNATVVVTGDTTLERVLPLLERHFGNWHPPSTARPSKALPASAAAATATRVFLIDKPDAIQSNILVGRLTPSSRAPNRLELETMNAVIGGTFTSRLNMNLREEKHWSYGVRSSLPDARGQRPWLLSSPVQTDKTLEAIAEIRRELADFVAGRPATSDEIAKVRNRDVRSLSGRYETNAAVSGAITDMVVFDRPDDYVRTLKAHIESQTDEAVRAAATEALGPGPYTWVVIGDLRKVEEPIRALDLGEVKVIDADGKILR